LHITVKLNVSNSVFIKKQFQRSDCFLLDGCDELKFFFLKG